MMRRRNPCPDCGGPKNFTSDRCRGCHQAFLQRHTVAGRAATNPQLSKKIAEGRRKADEDYRAMERWARSGGTTTSTSGRRAQAAV